MVGFPVARRELVLVVGGAAILMLPSMLYGRPFVYWDTPTFYSWGHDILAALRDPWPPLSDFPAHRGLWAADNMPGAWDRITPEQFQLVLTSIGARSTFYAVPLYVLGSTLTLWAVAFAQSLIGAWMLWTTCVTVLPGPRPSAYLCLVAALTVATTAPFFLAFLMPDVFAAFGLLSLALLLCFHDRLTPVRRLGCALLVAAAALVHLSNAPLLGALLVVALAAVRLLLPAVPALRGASTVAVALACAAGLAGASEVGMRAIFGQPVRPPPFVEGRVIADGPGQAFLRDACPTRPFAACRFKDLEVEKVTTSSGPMWGGATCPSSPTPRSGSVSSTSRRRWCSARWPTTRSSKPGPR